MMTTLFNRSLLVVAALFAACSSNFVVAQPEGFEDSRVDLNIPDGGGITDVIFTPTGTMVVSMKWGKVWEFLDFENDPNNKRLILDLSDQICTGSERAMGSVAFHPDFENNRYMYAYWTWPKHGNCDVDNYVTGPVNKLSRFTLLDNGIADMASETFILQSPVCPKNWHNGGKIQFGKDGLMYVSIGDGFQHREFTSQDMTNLWGTIIRITDTGEIPEDNPFADGPRCRETGETSEQGATCAEIYASGLRNPWKFAMDPNTKDNKVRFLISDVGASVWEELNEGGDDFPGANYGWPVRDGPCKFNGYSDTTKYFNKFEFPYEDCEEMEDRGFDDPLHYYTHNEQYEGACTSGAFVPNGLWPVEYDGAFIYADFIFNEVNIMREGGEECRSCSPPTSKYEIETIKSISGGEGVVAMTFGPYNSNQGQALYYATRSPHDVRRYVYLGDANRKPNADITSSLDGGPDGVTIEFDGTKSSDPDGDDLDYEWDFDGDGVPDSTEAKSSFTFVGVGNKQVSLTVHDGRGGEDTVTMEIGIGDRPLPTIIAPPVGTTFAVGDIFTLYGSAVHGDGSILPDSALHWEVQQHHLNHHHPFLGSQTQGNGITLLPAPEPEDFSASTSSYLKVILTATDSDGLSTTVTRDIMPRMVYMEFDSIPSNRELVVDRRTVVTPVTVAVWENQRFYIEAPLQYSASSKFTFNAWSDGMGKKHAITVLPSDTRRFIAEFTEEAKPDPPILLEENTIILTDAIVESSPKGTFLHQQTDGNLVLHAGSPGDSQGILWSTEYSGPIGDYYTIFQGDGNLVCRQGTPAKSGDVVFVTGSTGGGTGDYYFQYVPYEHVVIITKETPETAAPGETVANRLWVDNTNLLTDAPSVSPTSSPTETASSSPSAMHSVSPTAYPSVSPTQSPTQSPSEVSSSTPTQGLTSSPTETSESSSWIISEADPFCRFGNVEGKACCPKQCGKCGGLGCSSISRAGPEYQSELSCCSEHIVSDASRDCSKVGPPCTITQDREEEDQPHSSANRVKANTALGNVLAFVVPLASLVMGVYSELVY